MAPDIPGLFFMGMEREYCKSSLVIPIKDKYTINKTNRRGVQICPQ